MGRLTVKEQLQQVLAEMTEDEAVQALVLLAAAQAGATPTDMYGTAWGEVLRGVDTEVLAARGVASIEIPDGVLTVR